MRSGHVRTALVLGVLLAGADGASQIVPGFVPGHPARERASKKDPRVRAVPPVLRPTLCTLFNVHTLEALALDAAPAPDEIPSITQLLRDRATWEEHAIAPGCIATVRAAVAAFGARRVEVISGYRSDKLNEHLRKKGHHVAARSQHVLGNAVDFRLVGVPTPALLHFLRSAHDGGIGAYPQSGFVHVDVGPRRQWRGE